MSNLTFEFESQEVRFVGTSDDPWWVAADICAVLEIKNVSDALNRLDEDEKRDDIVIADTIGRNQAVCCINESGLYSLVLTSRKPQAKRFRKWVTAVVLPSIRKTGQYSVDDLDETDALLIQTQNAINSLIKTRKELREVKQVVQETKNKQDELEKEINDVRNKHDNNKSELMMINELVNDRISSIEVEQDRYETPCGHKYTVLGFACKQGLQLSLSESSIYGRKAAKLCKERGIEINRINDPRFGKVGLYPESILIEVFA